jgi:hypothetical protein
MWDKKPYIIQEQNVDGVGTNVSLFVNFSRALTEEEQIQLANELEKTRQKAIDADECFDTDEIVEDALQTFSQNYKLTYGYITIPTIAF